MAGIKYNAHGATVEVDGDAVEGIVSIEIGGGQTGEAEITDSTSSGVREYVAGLSDSGQLTLEMRHVPGAPGQENLRTLRASRDVVEVVVTLPASASDSAETFTLTFDAYVQSFDYSLPTAEDAAAMATCSLRVTGDVAEES
jgi:hypothetical protein